MRNILNNLAFIMFGISGGLLYAFVYDVEPVSPQKEYSLERDVFTRSHDLGDWSAEFPSFEKWCEERQCQEDRFHGWLSQVAAKIGSEVPYCFDPYYNETQSGQSAQAPENWEKGERE